jgi:hypothetical protein
MALATRSGPARPESSLSGPSRAAAAIPARAAGALGAGIALGAACDLKSTAWLAVTAVVLTAALAPAALTSWRGADALIQNSVLFPLGLTHDKTPAESLLPGHLLTALGTAGHVASVGLLLAAVLGVLISLVIRPPRDVPAAAWRLAIGLALMFLLGPQVRFGYFLYPLGLIGYLALTQAKAAATAP